ncbi:hypothetical protein Tco_0080046 [Tanacetum coccineum]
MIMIDNDPTNSEIKKEGVSTLNEYKEAVADEGKILIQKTKIDWLKEGDKNTTYFHKVLKSMQHKSRIECICDEDGNRYDRDQGHINYARSLMEIRADTILKHEVSMAILMEDGIGYSKAVIRVEYECKHVHSDPVREHVTSNTIDMNSDGFTEVRRKKNKGMKADEQPRSRHIEGIRLNKPSPNFYWQKNGNKKSGVDMANMGQVANYSINKASGPSTLNSFDVLNNVDVGDICGVSSYIGNQEEDQAVGQATDSKHTSSLWNEDFEFDDEVDEVIFPEGNKCSDKFDIRLEEYK